MTMHITGRVVNRAGQGINGVLVSNGEDVVLTDADGRYTLDTIPDAHLFIFVTVPDGYTTRDRFFQSIPSTSSTIDFALAPAPETISRVFSLVHITDIHLGVESGRVPTDALLVQDLRELEDDTKPDLIIATGDLTENGSVAELSRFRTVIAGVGRPFVPVWGGHDGTVELTEMDARQTCTRNYESVLGPVNYSFDWGGRHFVVYAAEDEYFSPGDVKRKERWLLQDLSMNRGNRETVVLMHPSPSVELLEQLADHKVSLVLHGHTHISKVFEYSGITVASLPPLCFGGIDTTPRAYRIVRFANEGFELELRPLGGYKPSQRRLLHIRTGPSDGARRPRWERKLPSSIHRAAPIARDGDLLLSLSDDHHRGWAGVYSVAGETGEPQWHSRTDASVKNSVVVSEDGHIVALSITGRLHTVDAKSGTFLWQADLPAYPQGRVATSPAVVDNTVYAGAEFGYGAFNLLTGEPRWYTPLEAVNRPCFASPKVYDDLLITVVRNRGLLALSRSDGRIVWERNINVEFQYPPPALLGNLLVSGADPGDLVVLDAGSGEVLWQRRMVEYTWMPETSKYLDGNEEWGYPYPTGLTIAGDGLYLATSGGEVLRCDLRTGLVRWRFQSGSDLLDMTPHRRGLRSILARPAPTADALMVGGIDGTLYFLDFETGECVERVQFPSPISAPPCVLDNGFCVGTWDGWLYRFFD